MKGTRAVFDDDLVVLFISKDAALTEMYRLKLELDGYRVLLAESGSDGLALARAQAPDIIFVDGRLPSTEGSDPLGEMRSDPRIAGIPRIILSDSETNPDLNDTGLGIRDYVVRSDRSAVSLSPGVREWAKRPT